MEINFNQIDGKKTKFKIVLSYFMFLAIVVCLVFFIYNRFNKIIFSIETLSEDKSEFSSVSRVTNGIVDMQAFSSIYTFTFDSTDYSNYKNTCKKVADEINHLYDYFPNKYIDSVNFYVTKYEKSINEWINLKIALKKLEFKKTSNLINEVKDSLIKADLIIPNSNTTLIEETTIKNILEPLIDEEYEDEENKTMFQKIFKKKKPKKEEIKAINTETTTIETQFITEYDTNYYYQVSVALSNIKEKVSDKEKLQKIQKNLVAELEIKLLATRSVLLTKINHVLMLLENEKNSQLLTNIQASKTIAENSVQSLIIILFLLLLLAIVFAYIIFTDLTKSSYYKKMLLIEKKQTEKLTKAKEQFLTTISHEIRSPLTNIIGLSEQLTNSYLSENDQKKLNAVILSSEHLNDIVNDVLDYSKIESGTLKFENIGFSISQVVEEAVQIVSYSAQIKNIELILNIENHDTILLGDPYRLKQVIINLLNNAIKFTEKGYIKLNVSFENHLIGYVLNCSVEDTGIGIHKDRINEIFKSFIQADFTTTRHFGGTGLGLPICKKIVEMQNGTIWANSELNKGSVFSFKIPFRLAQNDDYAVSNKNEIDCINTFRNKKIAFIDDDAFMQTLLNPFFEEWEIDCIFIHESILAQEHLSTIKFDLLFVDLYMPEMNGYQIIDWIKNNSESQNKDTKIIICSGADTDSIVDLDNHIVLKKPFKKATIKKALYESFYAGNLNKKEIHFSLTNFKVYANDDNEILKLFIKTFIEQSKIDLEAMKILFEKREFNEIGELAHKLKNTFGQLEATTVITILNYLEKMNDKASIDEKKVEEKINSLYFHSIRIFEQLKNETTK
jgi:signal transduction histidine kinase/CheY-like chemotaxis protein